MSVSKKAIICDLDGTLCNIDHRVHWVKTKPRNYNAFHSGCINDTPNEAVLMMLDALAAADVDILLFSGRDGAFREQTEKWLVDHDVPHKLLLMRDPKDYRKDNIIKSEMLALARQWGYNPIAAIDDRKQVKRMWVELGLFVFDVNQHDIEF